MQSGVKASLGWGRWVSRPCCFLNWSSCRPKQNSSNLGLASAYELERFEGISGIDKLQQEVHQRLQFFSCPYQETCLPMDRDNPASLWDAKEGPHIFSSFGTAHFFCTICHSMWCRIIIQLLISAKSSRIQRESLMHMKGRCWGYCLLPRSGGSIC